MSQVNTALAKIPLFDAAVIRGVRIIRRSLLGFQIDGREDLLDAAELAAELEGPRKGPRGPAAKAPLRKAASARIVLCSRCAGDGLGRRNRGACGLCRGPGIQAFLPPGGFAELPAEELAAAVDQAIAALRAAAYQRARESLVSLLAEALPFAPAPVQERARGEVRAA